MIGVAADVSDSEIVSEFFELFKTPWEFYRPGKRYEVLLAGKDLDDTEFGERLTVRYGGRIGASDKDWSGSEMPADEAGRVAHCPVGVLPLYGECVSWSQEAVPQLVRREFREGGSSVRAGYDLFHEVRWLLTRGQPPKYAAIPTLELHIELLRDLIRESGANCPEIRPTPDGYRFVAALTHDVDHPSLQLHGFDHTAAGFLYRATFGSVHGWATGRLRFGQVLRNWVAAIRWPGVALGLGRDFWRDFTDYTEFENGNQSTFFVIPFAGRSGRNGEHTAPAFRSSRYGAADIEAELQALRERGCEIALHGIDAWCEQGEAGRERAEIGRVSRSTPSGVRMHWLYFGSESTTILDHAGFDYDSTVGYNGTVGFRAGTGQVYRPLGAKRLLELPLLVMDTALFYPSHLNLKPAEAWKRVEAIVAHARRFGGCVTVNWHDRSIGPERQWGEFYRDLVRYLEEQGAWVTTAGEAVNWFQQRRSRCPIGA